MPLLKKKSQKAFEHNVKAEMDAGKPQKQSLAIAFDVKRRAKKAQGGMMEDNRSQAEASRLDAGYGRVIFKAEGGHVDAMDPIKKENYKHEGRMDKHNKKRRLEDLLLPKMIESSIIKPRRIDSLGHPMEEAHHAKHEHEERRKFAEGDEVEKLPSGHQALFHPPMRNPKSERHDFRPDAEAVNKDIADMRAKNMANWMNDEEGSGELRPAHTRKQEQRPGAVLSQAQSEHLKSKHPILSHRKRLYAEGGDVKETVRLPEESRDELLARTAPEQMHKESEEVHPESVAEAIRQKNKMARGGRIEHAGDEMLKEGEVDLDDNAIEIPNMEYGLNEHDAVEHNFDEDMMKMHQPKDSNEHGDDIESDVHDMVSKIMKKMRMKR